MKIDRDKLKKWISVLGGVSTAILIILFIFVFKNNGNTERNEELINVYIVLLVILVMLMVAMIILISILFKKNREANSEILKEYGTPESKTKKYEILFTGFEYCDESDVIIASKIKNSNLVDNIILSRRISLFFFPEGFCTNERTSFKWDKVNKIVIDRIQNHIQIILGNNEINADNVFLPLQTDIYYLVKTFYKGEIANDFIC